jgi:valyl-tRNA synthetase
MLAQFPEPRVELIDEESEWEMRSVIELISRARNIRSEMNIKPAERITVLVGAPEEKLRNVFRTNIDPIARLVRGEVKIANETNGPRASARAVLSGGAEIAVPLEGLIDFAQERQRLGKEREKLQSEANKVEVQLANPNFAQRAPAEKVEELRKRVNEIAQRIAQLQQTIENLL